MTVFAFGSGPWDPSHRFETSWCLPPLALGLVRGFFALYAFFTLFFSIGWQCAHPALGGCEAARASFSYFTVLTYWGLAFYFGAAATHTLSLWLSRADTPLLSRLPRPLQALHALFYSTVIVYPFIVTVVYWARIYSPPFFPGQPFNAWRNLSQHAFNSGFALFEIVIPRTAPPPWLHLLWLLVLLALYLGLAYVTRATKGFYVYDFLDPAASSHRGLVAAYVAGIAVACVVVFGLARGAVSLRLWFTEQRRASRRPGTVPPSDLEMKAGKA